MSSVLESGRHASLCWVGDNSFAVALTFSDAAEAFRAVGCRATSVGGFTRQLTYWNFTRVSDHRSKRDRDTKFAIFSSKLSEMKRNIRCRSSKSTPEQDEVVDEQRKRTRSDHDDDDDDAHEPHTPKKGKHGEQTNNRYQVAAREETLYGRRPARPHHQLPSRSSTFAPSPAPSYYHQGYASTSSYYKTPSFDHPVPQGGNYQSYAQSHRPHFSPHPQHTFPQGYDSSPSIYYSHTTISPSPYSSPTSSYSLEEEAKYGYPGAVPPSYAHHSREPSSAAMLTPHGSHHALLYAEQLNSYESAVQQARFSHAAEPFPSSTPSPTPSLSSTFEGTSTESDDSLDDLFNAPPRRLFVTPAESSKLTRAKEEAYPSPAEQVALLIPSTSPPPTTISLSPAYSSIYTEDFNAVVASRESPDEPPCPSYVGSTWLDFEKIFGVSADFEKNLLHDDIHRIHFYAKLPSLSPPDETTSDDASSLKL
ncbi:hypothetical protein MNV49_005133 [Pseudohyphozyma bogoriensis]|nr:hypothetical protein MNV49_005133 [Pseudohyphozyma bogoriensis]